MILYYSRKKYQTNKKNVLQKVVKINKKNSMKLFHAVNINGAGDGT